MEKVVVPLSRNALSTDAQVRAVEAIHKRTIHSCGNSLFLIIEPIAKGGGKSFIGRLRFPRGKSGKQIDVRIGVYGKSSGQWTLKAARDEWDRIKTWVRENQRHPKELLKGVSMAQEEERDLPTVLHAVEAFLERSRHAESTRRDYKNKLFNQVIPELGADTTLKSLEWEHGGREKILQLKQGIEARGSLDQSDKVLGLMHSVFDTAIDRGWMQPPNPALSSKQARSGHKSTPNPSLKWEQLPKFFDDLEASRKTASPIMVGAVQLTIMSFLRVGSLAPARWDEIDEKTGLWTVPAERMKSGKLHEVPLTDEVKELFKMLSQYNGNTDYCFYSPRGRKFKHINPYSINKFLVDMGYQSVTTAHGFRSLALTAGQEVLGYRHEVIRRQLAHVIGDKVQQSYDRAKFLDERREFMTDWCRALKEQGMRI